MSNPLARAREMHKAATEGPWHLGRPDEWAVKARIRNNPHAAVATCHGGLVRNGEADNKDNARAIVVEHNTYAALLDGFEVADEVVNLLRPTHGGRGGHPQCVKCAAVDLYDATLATLEARIKEETDE